jgi:transcriptional regulator with XRE-family HTH domain
VARYRLAARGVEPEQVRAARGLAGIGQRDLALRLGIARSSIADAERRRRRVHPALAQWVRAVLREAGTGEPPA